MNIGDVWPLYGVVCVSRALICLGIEFIYHYNFFEITKLTEIFSKFTLFTENFENIIKFRKYFRKKCKFGKKKSTGDEVTSGLRVVKPRYKLIDYFHHIPPIPSILQNFEGPIALQY